MTQNAYRANYSNLNLNIFYATVLRRHWLDFNNFGCFEKVWTCILHFWYQCRHFNDYDYHYQWLCSLLKKNLKKSKISKSQKSKISKSEFCLWKFSIFWNFENFHFFRWLFFYRLNLADSVESLISYNYYYYRWFCFVSIMRPDIVWILRVWLVFIVLVRHSAVSHW